MEWSSVLVMASLGVLLAAATGLRAFIPPFILACVGGLGWIRLGDGFTWLASPLVIGTLGAAIVVEILADKVPLVDHCVDAVQFLVKPVAGAITAAAAVGGTDPAIPAMAALLAGGAVAGATHTAKAATRAGSTASTGGTANPVLSVIEDVLALAVAGAVAWGVAGIG